MVFHKLFVTVVSCDVVEQVACVHIWSVIASIQQMMFVVYAVVLG